MPTYIGDDGRRIHVAPAPTTNDLPDRARSRDLPADRGAPLQGGLGRHRAEAARTRYGWGIWQAECPCGWRSSASYSRGGVEADADEHNLNRNTYEATTGLRADG